MLNYILKVDVFYLTLGILGMFLIVTVIFIIQKTIKSFLSTKQSRMHSIGIYIKNDKDSIRLLLNSYMKKAWSEIRQVIVIYTIITMSISIGILFYQADGNLNQITTLRNVVDSRDTKIVSINTELNKINTDYKSLYDAINIPPNIGGFDVSLDELENIPIGCPIEPTSFWVSSFYGKRLNPFTKKVTSVPHSGIDLVGPMAAQIMTTGTGTVKFIGWDPNGILGRMVVIDHQNGFETIYGHLSRIYVNVGEEVTLTIIENEDGSMEYIGTVLGRQGSTGLTTGEHVHYGISWNGKWINPMLFLASFINQDPNFVEGVVRVKEEYVDLKLTTDHIDMGLAVMHNNIGGSYIVNEKIQEEEEKSRIY